MSLLCSLLGYGRALCLSFFFFSSRRRHTRLVSDWSSDVCSSDLASRCMGLGFIDLIIEGIDENAARDLVHPHAFATRFRQALGEPPHNLGLTTPLQRAAWDVIVAHSGRPVTTKELAKSVGLSREHLSRNFAKPGAPNLKRVIDLVRLIAAAELAKNPGHDIRDIARILDFVSSSHLAVTAQRIFGTRPASLARLRTTDLIDRFAQGRTRSRT